MEPEWILQADEAESLLAIYGDEGIISFDASEDGRLRPGSSINVKIGVEFDTTQQITINRSTTTVSPSVARLCDHQGHTADPSTASSPSAPSLPTSLDLTLSHLPPIHLAITLPPDYPLSSPPTIESISPIPDTPSYLPLPVLSALLHPLLVSSYASIQAECLFSFIESIRTGSFLLNPEAGLVTDDGRLVLRQEEGVGDDLARVGAELTRWNGKVMGLSFDSQTFDCEICFESRKGAKCSEFPCRHIFCRSCLKDCFSLAIREGDIAAVACPSFECTKARSKDARLPVSEPAIEAILREVLGADDEASIERWKSLREKQRVESDPSYTYCPIETCQTPVPPPPSTVKDPSAAEDRWDKYRKCPKCHYSFCLYCRQNWHGVHLPCPLPSLPSFILTYLSLEADDPSRPLLEARYGKKNLERLARAAVEEMENKKWLDEKTAVCPGCGVRIEKSHGCNHVICRACQAHLCFRCSKPLSALHPYKHYQEPGTSCFEKLFDQEEIDRFNREAGRGGNGDVDWRVLGGG